MCMFNNKEFSISKQATIRDTDAGKRFSSSSNAAACFLSNPEGVYLFILSDPKDLWLLNPNKAFFIYIYIREEKDGI